MVRRDRCLTRPTGVDDVGQLVGDVERKAVVPPIIEPGFQLSRRIVLQHIHVELALHIQPGKGQIAAAHKARDRVIEVRAKEQIELRMQWIPQVKLDHDLARAELCAQPPQPGLIRVRRHSHHELVAELFRRTFLQSECLLLIDPGVSGANAQC